jgi:hypothetical protein
MVMGTTSGAASCDDVILYVRRFRGCRHAMTGGRGADVVYDAAT